jgi:hypothetical protein
VDLFAPWPFSFPELVSASIWQRLIPRRLGEKSDTWMMWNKNAEVVRGTVSL